jgi:hypothetical protein
VAGGHTFTALTAGDYHTCGVTTGGEVLCWGLHPDAPLGDVSPEGSAAEPRPVGEGLVLGGT